MIHHLRGTSTALAEKVFIRGGKRHGNYGRGLEVSTLVTAESTSRSPHRQGRWHPECFLEIIMRLPVLLPIVYSLFAPFLFAADPSSSAAIPDSVIAAAIIYEMNLARQNPALYATPLEQRRQNYSGGVCLLPGNVRLHTHEGVRALDDAIRFLHRAKPQPPLALSPGLCLAAAAYGSHARFGSVCSIDFASGYVENRLVRAGSDAQNSF